MLDDTQMRQEYIAEFQEQLSDAKRDTAAENYFNNERESNVKAS